MAAGPDEGGGPEPPRVASRGPLAETPSPRPELCSPSAGSPSHANRRRRAASNLKTSSLPSSLSHVEIHHFPVTCRLACGTPRRGWNREPALCDVPPHPCVPAARKRVSVGDVWSDSTHQRAVAIPGRRPPRMCHRTCHRRRVPSGTQKRSGEIRVSGRKDPQGCGRVCLLGGRGRRLARGEPQRAGGPTHRLTTPLEERALRTCAWLLGHVRNPNSVPPHLLHTHAHTCTRAHSRLCFSSAAGPRLPSRGPWPRAGGATQGLRIPLGFAPNT